MRFIDCLKGSAAVFNVDTDGIQSAVVPRTGNRLWLYIDTESWARSEFLCGDGEYGGTAAKIEDGPPGQIRQLFEHLYTAGGGFMFTGTEGTSGHDDVDPVASAGVGIGGNQPKTLADIERSVPGILSVGFHLKISLRQSVESMVVES